MAWSSLKKATTLRKRALQKCTCRSLAVAAISSAMAMAMALPSIAQAEDAPAEQQAVDPAAKKFMAAQGKLERGLYKLAAQEYEEFLSAYPGHAQQTAARYALAVSHYRLGETDAALPLLAQVISDSKFPQRDEALAVLGHCRLAKKEYAPAQAAFGELVDQYPNSKQAELASLNRAQAFYLAGSFKDSAAAADAYLGRYPQGAHRDSARYFLALAQRGVGQNEAAVAALRALLKESPRSPLKLDATLLLGQAFESLNQLDEAATAYREFEQIAPAARKPDAFYSLGVVLYKAAKYDQSVAALLNIAKDFPTHPYAKPALLQLGRAELAAGKVKDAREVFEVVARIDPERAADARYGLAQTDIAEKKWDAARSRLEQLIAAAPAPANLAQLVLDRAAVLGELGQYEQAAAGLATFDQQFAQSPLAAEAKYRRAFALHKLKQYEQSSAIAGTLAVGPASDFSRPAAELDAENLFLLARYPQAAKAFATLREGEKDLSRAARLTLRLGECAYFANDFAQAAALLKPLADDAKTPGSAELRRAIFLYGDALLQQNQFAEAARAFGAYLGAAGGAPAHEAQFKRALALRRAQDSAAEQALGEIAAGPRDNPWVQRGLFEIGQHHYEKGEKEAAARELGKLLEANPPADVAAPALYLLGWTDFDAKRFEPAAERWEKLTQNYAKHPLAADAAYQRGVALQEGKKNEQALAALREYVLAHGQESHAADARHRIAAALTALGRHEEARAALAELAGGKDAGDAVLYDLAWSQHQLKDDASAVLTYRRLLKEFGQSKLAPAARTELAHLLYAQNQYDEARTLLEAAAADAAAAPATRADATYLLGSTYDKLGQAQLAAATFEKFAQSNPDDKLTAAALLQAGLASASQGKHDQAARSLAQLLQKYPQHEQASLATLKLGESQLEMGDHPAALRTFEEFKKKFAKDPLAYRAEFGVGWANENLKQYDAARQAYQRVIDQTNTPTAARAQFQIGETYLAEQKFEQGAAALLSVADVYAYPEWSARALVEAGRAFEQLKQPDQARKQFEQVISKYKDAPEADLARERIKALAP